MVSPSAVRSVMSRLEYQRRFVRHLTIQKLALISGVSHVKITWIERGRLVPTDQEASLLADALDLPLAELMVPARVSWSPVNEQQPEATA